MPLEGLEEEGLPKNPDLQLVQWKFQLTVEEVAETEKEEIWEKLLAAIKENCKLDLWRPTRTNCSLDDLR